MHVLGHPFFGSVQYMFSNLAVFFWTWGHEKCGRLACVFPGPCDDNFYGPGWIWLDLKEFFWTERGIYFWHRFLFFGPVHLLCGPCFHRSGRDLHCYMRWMLFGPWCTCFFDLSQGRGNLDSATRCVQEVVAGETRILKQHKRKKLWRSQRGEAYIWNQMDAGSWEAHWREGKVRNWNQMIARSCERCEVKPTLKLHEDTKMLRGTGRGELDIEARCMQEDVERKGGTCRYWSQMTAENWWETGRWEGGS